MDAALGKGGVAAMIGHGGLCARILNTGYITVGDRLEVRPKGENLELFYIAICVIGVGAKTQGRRHRCSVRYFEFLL